MERYSKAYLDDIVAAQGGLFSLLAERFPECDTAELIAAYMRSRVRRDIDNGQAYIMTMQPEDLLQRFLSEKPHLPSGGVMQGFAPDWIGRFYAVCQWQKAIPSEMVVSRLPVDYMTRIYPGLHDLELDMAVDKIWPD